MEEDRMEWEKIGLNRMAKNSEMNENPMKKG